MGIFFVYILKSAICMAAFYLFYKILLSRDTFHRFNRFALLGILVGSFVLPVLNVQSHIQQETTNVLLDLGGMMVEPFGMIESNVEEDTFHWASVLLLIYIVGVVCFWAKHLYAIGSLVRLIRTGRKVRREDGTVLVLYKKDIAPFSWMHYIVISEEDLGENGEIIIRHETAHIRNRHSWDLIVADLCISLQWFNPAVWLVKSELQNVHEFEADESVINQGVDAKKYQLLLIKKAVGTRLYSMANSFNHSTLKKRITMMIKKKSNPWARLKYLYVLPLATIAVAAFARPEISSELDEISNAKVSDLSAIMKAESPKNVVEDQKTTVPQDQVVNQDEVFMVVENPPEYPGGIQELMKFLGKNIKYPAEAAKANIQGRVIVQFVVMKDGSVANLTIKRSVHPLLDAEALRVLAAMPKWKPGTQKGKAVNVKYIIPVAFGLKSTETKSQNESPKNVVENQKTTVPQNQVVNQDEIFRVVENPPEYPGGIQELMKFLGKNVKYPAEAAKANIQGRVIVQFVVMKDGSVANLTVKRSVHPLLDAEALRVLATMPKWKPGIQKGKAVNVKYIIPVTFGLKSTETKSQDENQLSLRILSNEKNDALDRAQQIMKTPVTETNTMEKNNAVIAGVGVKISGTATNTLKSPIIVVDKKVMGTGFDASKNINSNDIESIVVLKNHEQITKFISQGIPLQLSETEIQKFKKLYNKEKNNGVLFIVMKKK